jgi:spore coat polysaccharide biosynthesis protein SpsF
VVIQSRLSSSRLPGKALLTLGGMPLVELVARRASRSGHEVVVATSEEQYDARIAEHLRSVGIAVVRGPLDDVLGRFVAATADLDPTDRVVRLTGDNPVADADIVDELLAAVDASGHTYGRVDIDRVPEGLGAEAFPVGALRLAAVSATRSYDREHVTPWLRRELGELLFVPAGLDLDPRRFRCTVDVLADYVRVADLFGAHPDPVSVPWRTLLSGLASRLGDGATYLPVRGWSGTAPSALVLGLDGLAGADAAQLRRMAQVAADFGVTHVDTGAAGGGGQALFRVATEPALVQRFSTVTRIAANSQTPGTGGPDSVDRALERASATLGRRRCGVVLFDGVPAAASDAAAWQRVAAHRDAGEVDRVGVRVHSPEELWAAVRLPGLGYLELPVPARGEAWWAGGTAAAALASASASPAGSTSASASAQSAGSASRSACGVVVSAYAEERGCGREAARMLRLPWVTTAVVTPGCEQELRAAARVGTA